MKQHSPIWTSLVIAAAVLGPVELLAIPSPASAAGAQHGGGHSSGASGRSQSGGRAAVPRGEGSSGTKAAAPTGENTGGTDRQAGAGSTGAAHAVARGSETSTRKAVPRGSVPPASGGTTTIVVPGYGYGFYPWAFGGLGFGGYYGGFYDPWYERYPTDPQGGYSLDDQGSLRIKVEPREAQIDVDGYYAGVVDDYDGIFQRLHLRSGPHRIEIRAPGFETLTFDVQIERDRTITYQGELKPIQ